MTIHDLLPLLLLLAAERLLTLLVVVVGFGALWPRSSMTLTLDEDLGTRTERRETIGGAMAATPQSDRPPQNRDFLPE